MGLETLEALWIMGFAAPAVLRCTCYHLQSQAGIWTEFYVNNIFV